MVGGVNGGRCEWWEVLMVRGVSSERCGRWGEEGEWFGN